MVSHDDGKPNTRIVGTGLAPVRKRLKGTLQPKYSAYATISRTGAVGTGLAPPTPTNARSGPRRGFRRDWAGPCPKMVAYVYRTGWGRPTTRFRTGASPVPTAEYAPLIRAFLGELVGVGGLAPVRVPTEVMHYWSERLLIILQELFNLLQFTFTQTEFRGRD